LIFALFNEIEKDLDGDSKEDIALTIVLQEALLLLEVNLLDHCIVTKRGASSFSA
jgi:DNA repair protein RadC